MQLKLRRSQRDGGVISKNVIFCLDARADLTDQERYNLTRYKLFNQVIYNSEAAKAHLDKTTAHLNAGGATGLLKGAMHLALTAMKLNITIRSLERGQHIECKSMEELLAAEEALMEACQNLKTFLEVAATFDGSEVVIDFSDGEARAVASAIRPEPILAPVGHEPLSALSSTPTPALHAPAAQYSVPDDQDVSVDEGGDATAISSEAAVPVWRLLVYDSTNPARIYFLVMAAAAVLVIGMSLFG